MLIKDEISKDFYKYGHYSFLTWFYENLKVNGSKDDYIYDCQRDIARHLDNLKINEIYLRGGRQCGLTTFTMGFVAYNSLVSDEDMSIFLFSHNLESAVGILDIYKRLLDGCSEKLFVKKYTKNEISFRNINNHIINVQALPLTTNVFMGKYIENDIVVFDNFEYTYPDFIKYNLDEAFMHFKKCKKYFISTSEHYVGDGTDFMNSSILHSTESNNVFGYEFKSVRGTYKNDDGDIVEIMEERPDLVLSLIQQGYKKVANGKFLKDPDYI